MQGRPDPGSSSRGGGWAAGQAHTMGTKQANPGSYVPAANGPHSRGGSTGSFDGATDDRGTAKLNSTLRQFLTMTARRHAPTAPTP